MAELGELLKLIESMKLEKEAADRRAEEAYRRAEEERERAAEADRRAEGERERAEKERERAEEADRRAKEERERAEEADRRAKEERERAEEERERAEEADRRAEEADRRVKEERQRAEEQWKVKDLIGSYSPSSLANIAESNGVVNTYKRCEESRIVLGWSPIIRESATLLYPDFSNFANNVRNQNVEDPDDPRILYARKYIPILRNHFSNEAERRKSFCKMLRALIPELKFHEEFQLTEEQMGGKVVVLRTQGGQPGEKPRKAKKNKAKQTIVKEKCIAKYIKSDVIGTSEKSGVHEEVPVVIAEIKNEEGCTTSEPLVEAMGYYNCFALAATLANNSIPLLWPSLIILHVGKSIRVYGAVTFIRVNPESQQREPHYLCEHLYSLQLNDHDEKALQEMCKFLVVLCDQVKSILEFRSDKGMDPGCAGIPFLIRDDPNFLKQTGFVELMPNTHVYVNGSYVWKFTRHYSQEAHKRAAELKIAPALHYCNTVGEWNLVCMQKVSGEIVQPKTLRENPELWDKFNQRVARFHEEGFVHGDMRQQNIMFGSLPGQKPKSFFILDFDWAGKENQARYPISINMDGNIKWPMGVSPRGIISSHHDVHWLSTLYE